MKETPAIVTKSIRLTEAEAGELREYVAATGEVEASALKRAALRGLKELRLEQGILAYVGGRSSSEAADIAGIPRAELLQILIDKGVTILEGPSTLASELSFMAEHLGDERLAAAARKLAESKE
jgi:predicted HTH domain antitoxin